MTKEEIRAAADAAHALHEAAMDVFKARMAELAAVERVEREPDSAYAKEQLSIAQLSVKLCTVKLRLSMPNDEERIKNRVRFWVECMRGVFFLRKKHLDELLSSL